MRFAQRYMVLKDGVTVAQGELADTCEDDLVAMMLEADAGPSPGREHRTLPSPPPSAKPPRIAAPPALRVEGLTTASLRDVSFQAQEGEIVGIAGLRGSGQTQLCRALAGADLLTAGRIELRGKVVAPRSPHHAWKLGIGLMPLDRKTQGLFMNMTVAENIAMSRLVNGGLRWATKRRQRAIAVEYQRRLDIRLPGGNIDTPVVELSGGNQQKVVIARCLAAGPSVLILDDPTRGVDVGAKRQIHELVAGMAAAGLCVIVSSSEVTELLGLCTVVVVLHRGEMTATLRGPELDEHNIVRHASGL
jgi:ABC-type sugar transport system ATPase subunit